MRDDIRSVCKIEQLGVFCFLKICSNHDIGGVELNNLTSNVFRLLERASNFFLIVIDVLVACFVF